MRRFLLAAAGLAVLSGCAVRLGGPKPEEFQTLTLSVPDGSSPAQVAQTIRDAGASLVLLTANQDSAWFDEVATASGLTLSGPGRTEPAAKAFLTSRLEILGDTSIVIGVGDGSRMHMHDALYQIGENRLIDLMFVSIARDADLREAARTLLSYIATDVGPNAALIIALDAQTPAAGDSMSVLLRAAYGTAHECATRTADGAMAEPGRVRMLYGPSARMRCSTARVLPGQGAPVTALLVVGRQ